MIDKKNHKIITYCIAAVWIANGLFCKVLNLVPRHEQIVARILGSEHSRAITLLIGFAEVIMAIWILTGIKIRLNVLAQIVIVAIMNSLEFILAPDLLLWGKLNLFFACLFILFLYYQEFYLNQQVARPV